MFGTDLPSTRAKVPFSQEDILTIKRILILKTKKKYFLRML